MDVFVERRGLYSEIQKLLVNRAYQRRLCILFGEFGVGKTTLLNKLEQDLSNNLKIRLDLSNELQFHPPTLKNVVTDFVKYSGVLFSQKSKNHDSGIGKKILNIFKELSLVANLEVDTQGNIKGRLSANIFNPIINLIESRHESYTDTAKNAQLEDLPLILARITTEICAACNDRLFIIIDDVDKLDMQIASYLDQLLKTKLNIAFIVSIENDFISFKNDKFMQLLYSRFLKLKDINEKFDYELTYFDDKETLEYISKTFKSPEYNNMDIAKSVYDYTQGYPYLLSLVCKDETNIQSIYKDKGITFKTGEYFIFYKKIMDSFESNHRKMLFLLICNQLHINYEVLKKIMLHTVDINTFLDIFERLQREKHIEEKDKIIYIKHRMFADYINKTQDYLSELRRTEYYSIILEEYENLPDSKGGVEKYNSLTYLYFKVEEFDKAYAAVTHCSELLVKEKMPDKAVSFLRDIIEGGMFKQFNDEQKSKLRFKLCNSYSLCKDMDNVIKTFNDFVDAEKIYLARTGDYAEILLTVSQAYYYKNMPKKAIEYAEMVCIENIHSIGALYYKAMSLISSSYDLLGEYNTSISAYNTALNEAELKQDIVDLGIYKMTIQMIHSNYDTCLNSIMEAIEIFTKKHYDARHLACCYNNIGIEYLMNGDFEKSKDFLLKAETIFASFLSVESHFTENNLGIYYFLSDERDYEKALRYLKNAYEHAISPLQHSYAAANTGIVLFEMGKKEDALNWFKTSLGHSKDCPDPIVTSYIMFNLAQYHLKIGNKEQALEFLEKSKTGMEKDQLKCLLIKRERLINIIKSKKSDSQPMQFELSQRRKLFASSEWEPCELMFYN